MKTRILLMLVTVLTLGISQNLLQNPGFETWIAGMPEHWFRDESIRVYQEDVIVHTGNFSARDSLFTTIQATADFYQTVPFAPNTQCTMTVWVYDNDPAGRIGIGIYWYPSGSYWPNIFSIDQTSWQMLTLTTTSPSDAESAIVDLRAYDVSANWDGDAIFYIDDVFFGTTAVQSPVIVRFWHTPTNPGPSTTSSVSAYVVDDGTIDHDTLFYGINDLNSPIALNHTTAGNDTFNYEIPGQAAGDTVFYYLKFVDNDGLAVVSDTHAYYVGAVGVYVNEIYYDTPGTDSLCFVEVFGPGAMNLDGFSLVGINGNGGASYATIDLTGQTIPGDGFFVVGDNSAVANVDLVDPLANLQNGEDNLELRYHGITVDAVGYGTIDGWVFTGEWLPAPMVLAGHSLGRYPDGYDTDNNALDFYDYEIPSPGVPNPPVGIVEHDAIRDKMPLPNVVNPVRSGILYSVLVKDLGYYPLTIYNTIGQAVKHVSKPESRLFLPTGVYFMRLNNADRRCTKIVVVD
jgi:hypothetical protein